MESAHTKPSEGMSTFEHQGTLPHLPVPPLEETVQRFLEWTGPLLSEEQREKTEKAARDFLDSSGAGPLLQRALEERAGAANMPNWLEPFWNDGYLFGRLSLPIYSNIFYLLENASGEVPPSQAERAAALALRGVAFYRILREESFPPSTERGTPLCMSQYRRIFGASRIPRRGRDVLRNMVSSEAEPVENPRHMMVIFKGRFYRLFLLDEKENPCSYESLRKTLQEILEDSRPPLEDEESLGLFTGWNRDCWARGRELLLEYAPENRELLGALEESLFVMALDHGEPEDRDALGAAMLHGDGRSRWFDKTLQFIVTPRGEAAINMEHSGTDGSIMSSLAAFFRSGSSEISGFSEENSESLSFQEMVPRLSPELRKLLREAADAYDELRCKTSVRTLFFEDFGKDIIKSLKVSPDAFVQMGLQLARYRTFGSFCTTYEPVMTRRFLHGRTEPIRTVSRESCRFVLLMGQKTSPQEKALALREAAEEHVRRGRACKDGHGVDRHLYGLLQMYRRKGDCLGVTRLPSLFLSPGWQVLLRNVLSTSTSASEGLDLAGFGPVVEEGFGARYLIFPESLHFCLSSRVHLEASLERFREELARSFREMREILEKEFPER